MRYAWQSRFGLSLLVGLLTLATADPLMSISQAQMVGSGVRQHPADSDPLPQMHLRAYRSAMDAGYSPQQAQAYADSIAHQYRQSQAAPGPHSYHAAAQVNHERQRVYQQQQASAANQNARLWQALQQQRSQAHRPRAYAAPNSGPRPAATAAARSASQPAVRTGHVQVPSHIGADSESGWASPAAAANDHSGPLPSVDPDAFAARSAFQRLAELRRQGQAPEPVVLDHAHAMELQAPPQPAQPVPATIASQPTPKVSSPAPTDEVNGESPAPADPSGLRSPRKLPQVDPLPLQTPRRQIEIELEGFLDPLPPAASGDSSSRSSVRPMSYQEPLELPEIPAAAWLEEASQSDQRKNAERSVLEGSARADELPPPSLSGPRGTARGFSIEPIADEGSRYAAPADVNPLWMNEEPSATAVPSPTGIRATPVGRSSNHRSGDHRRPAASSASLSGRFPQDDPALEFGAQDSPERLPLPRGMMDQEDDRLSESFMKSCSQMRNELLGTSLRQISLDLSTPESDLPARTTPHSVRTWRDGRNQALARGRALSATPEQVLILEDDGNRRSLPLEDLSAVDQKYAWDLMDLPFECGFTSVDYQQRSFVPSLVTWHASNLCHKPLYFEDIQLERYGHTVGPIRQPLHSLGRFLTQAALLPYQMALHPANECQYSLGLFRPGSCAPYLRDPFPWERRAIGYQAGVAAGIFLLVP